MTYLAPVIKPTKQQLVELDNIILKFLYPKKHTFTAERTFTDKKALGLDILRVTHFINSLALNFALRSAHSIQPWAQDLKKLFISSNIRHSLRFQSNLSGYNLLQYAQLISEFNKQFYLKASCVWSSPIFCVSSITDPERSSYLPTPPQVRNTLLTTATVGSIYIFSQGRLLSAYKIGLKFGVFLNMAK